MTTNYDARLLRLNYLSEIGDLLVTAGVVITAAATAECLDVLELALLLARNTLLSGIQEFTAIIAEVEHE